MKPIMKRHMNRKGNHLSEPLVVNMGISSGNAFVGTAKFESLTGCGCAYKARGMVTNPAARLGAFASEGAILLCRSTADRVDKHFSLTPLGKFELRNVSDETDIFSAYSRLEILYNAINFNVNIKLMLAMNC